jgi:hypothetical protein
MVVLQVRWLWPGQWEKSNRRKPRETPKLSNNFEPVGRQNLPCVAKAGGGVSKPEAAGAGSTHRKWPQEGTPRKKAQGGEGTFVFRIDRERERRQRLQWWTLPMSNSRSR